MEGCEYICRHRFCISLEVLTKPMYIRVLNGSSLLGSRHMLPCGINSCSYFIDVSEQLGPGSVVHARESRHRQGSRP